MGKSVGQIIGAVVAATIAFAFGHPELSFAFIATLGSAVALGSAIGGLIDPPSVASPNFGSIGSAVGSPRYGFDKLQSTASADLPVPVFYGELKLAGNIIYQSEEVEVSSATSPIAPSTGGESGGTFLSTSDSRTEVTRCIAICEGQIQEVSDVRINDEVLSEFPNCNFNIYYGTSTQVVDPRFTGVLDGLRYTAYLALTLATSEKLKSNPSVTFKAKGKIVKTWNGSEWSSTKTFSDNPAACIRDFLTSKQYGVGLPESSIDENSFGSVFEYCNGLVTGFNGDQTKRAVLNYVIDSRRNILDVMNDMMATFGGYLILNGSKVKLKAERAEAPTQFFNMSNIVRGSFSYTYLDRNERPNRVRVQYIDPDYNYTKVFAIADDPNDQDERRAMGVGEDVIEKELALLGVTNPNQASRMAEFFLNLGKTSNILATFDVGIRALSAEVGDVVAVSHDVSGWVDKQFRIIAMEEKENEQISILGREYNASIYSDNPGQNIIFQNSGGGFSSFNTPNAPRNFTVFQSGSVINFTWDAPIPKFEVIIDHYEIREGDSWSGGLVVANGVTGTSMTITSFTTGVKTYHIRAVSDQGIMSASATDSIDIGIPAGFNAIIEYDDVITTRFELGGVYSDGIEVIRTTDYDDDQYLRAYGIKTEETWDEDTWDDGGIWDSPIVTSDETIVIGGNNEIDLLSDTTAKVALEVSYFTSHDDSDGSFVRDIEISTKASDGDWSPYASFVTGYSITLKQFIKFRVTIGSSEDDHDIRLYVFNCRVDVPDKIERDENVIVPSTGLSVIYNTEFLSKVAVTVTTVGNSPLIPRTYNKSLTGFSVVLEDTNSVVQDGVVDWIASGY